jgi:GMP synthase-like glutamine amidotransferase
MKNIPLERMVWLFLKLQESKVSFLPSSESSPSLLITHFTPLLLLIIPCTSSATSPSPLSLLYLPSTFEYLIVLGGPYSINRISEHRFLLDELSFIRSMILDHKKPTLGVCLGSQLIAKALGATVRKNSQDEIGWFSLFPSFSSTSLSSSSSSSSSLSSSSPVSFLPTFWSFPAFQWHSDTFDIPSGGLLLCSTPSCPNQGFSWPSSTSPSSSTSLPFVFGFQFHPEMTPEMLGLWILESFNQKDLANSPQLLLELEEMSNMKREEDSRWETLHQACHEIILSFLSISVAPSHRTKEERGAVTI